MRFCTGGFLLVDKTLILRKLADLEQYLDQIREFSKVSAEVYSGDWKIQRIVERTLQIMIELCIDIAGHIISDQKLRVPVNYADTFKSLAETGLITPDILDIMVKMAKFRNIVVHQYESVDTAIVIMILNNHLGDFLRFRDAVLNVLNNARRLIIGS
jgi:uncharacterized protein YutE (UPF0331/DUF86 family)